MFSRHFDEFCILMEFFREKKLNTNEKTSQKNKKTRARTQNVQTTFWFTPLLSLFFFFGKFYNINENENEKKPTNNLC